MKTLQNDNRKISQASSLSLQIEWAYSRRSVRMVGRTILLTVFNCKLVSIRERGKRLGMAAGLRLLHFLHQPHSLPCFPTVRIVLVMVRNCLNSYPGSYFNVRWVAATSLNHLIVAYIAPSRPECRKKETHQRAEGYCHPTEFSTD